MPAPGNANIHGLTRIAITIIGNRKCDIESPVFLIIVDRIGSIGLKRYGPNLNIEKGEDSCQMPRCGWIFWRAACVTCVVGNANC